MTASLQDAVTYHPYRMNILTPCAVKKSPTTLLSGPPPKSYKNSFVSSRATENTFDALQCHGALQATSRSPDL